MPRVRVYLVRHGETKENLLGIFQGHMDTELSDQGINQAELVANALKDIPFNVGLTSDLSRAKNTALEILGLHPHIEVKEDRQLRERFMGNMQGKKASKEGWHALAHDETVETMSQLGQRTLNWWKSTILPLASKAKGGEGAHTTVVLAVSHGAFLITLLNELISENMAAYTGELPLSHCLNTSISILDLESDDLPAVLVKHNDISHLSTSDVVVRINVDD
ncbi:phosphoglycerate mutase-like protein, partial [Coprinopsis marcescibilis]